MELIRNFGVTIVFLSILIFVHELGHFLVARLLNVKVLKFSIGFGPRIFSFTRGETEYQLSWIPLGGYVKMAGEQPGEEVSSEDEARSFLAQSPWRRALISAAGPAFNLLFPILAYGFVLLGTTQEISTRIGSVEPGFPAARAQLEPGDRILEVDGVSVRNFTELQKAIRHAFEKTVVLKVERDGRTFEKSLIPEKTVDVNGVESSNRGMIGITPYARAPLLGVPPNSVAALAGFKTFDRVLSINGQAVKDEVALKRLLLNRSGVLTVQVARLRPIEAMAVTAQTPEVVTISVERQPGTLYDALGAEAADLYVYSVVPQSPLAMAGVQKGDRIVSVDGQVLANSQVLLMKMLRDRMDRPFELLWQSQDTPQKATVQFAETQIRNAIGMKQKVKSLGLGGEIPLSQASAPELISVNRNVPEAFLAGLSRTGADIKTTALMFGRLFLGKLSSDSIGSVGTLFKVASASAAMGLDVFVQSMAVVSISLGLVNLFPIPVLDGFQLLTAGWEAIRRRPLTLRARDMANRVGLAMLLTLMALAIFNDIRNW